LKKFGSSVINVKRSHILSVLPGFAGQHTQNVVVFRLERPADLGGGSPGIRPVVDEEAVAAKNNVQFLFRKIPINQEVPMCRAFLFTISPGIIID
jgi:hypothetical protein